MIDFPHMLNNALRYKDEVGVVASLPSCNVHCGSM